MQNAFCSVMTRHVWKNEKCLFQGSHGKIHCTCNELSVLYLIWDTDEPCVPYETIHMCGIQTWKVSISGQLAHIALYMQWIVSAVSHMGCRWALCPIWDHPYLRHTKTKSILSRSDATHCNAATRCDTLRHTATHHNTLQHTTTHYNTLQHTATHCNALQHIHLPLSGQSPKHMN